MVNENHIIKNVDMPENMVDDAEAIETHTVERDIAAHIKKEFDRKYDPTWHCIVGTSFGSYISHESRRYYLPSCLICQDPLHLYKPQAVPDACGHLFHYVCRSAEDFTCPLCRTVSVKVVQVNLTIDKIVDEFVCEDSSKQLKEILELQSKVQIFTKLVKDYEADAELLTEKLNTSLQTENNNNMQINKLNAALAQKTTEIELLKKENSILQLVANKISKEQSIKIYDQLNDSDKRKSIGLLHNKIESQTIELDKCKKLIAEYKLFISKLYDKRIEGNHTNNYYDVEMVSPSISTRLKRKRNIF